jgi:hypothetical protein
MWKLAHSIDAKRSHNLPSENWRTRKTDGIIQSKCEDLKTKGTDI